MTSTSFSLKPAFNRAKQTVDCQVIQNFALALKTRQSRKFPSVENDKLVAYQTLFPLRWTFTPTQPHNLNNGRNDALKTKQY